MNEDKMLCTATPHLMNIHTRTHTHSYTRTHAHTHANLSMHISDRKKKKKKKNHDTSCRSNLPSPKLYTDTGSTRPSTDPRTPGTRQSSHQPVSI